MKKTYGHAEQSNKPPSGEPAVLYSLRLLQRSVRPKIFRPTSNIKFLRDILNYKSSKEILLVGLNLGIFSYLFSSGTVRFFTKKPQAPKKIAASPAPSAHGSKAQNGVALEVLK